MSEEEKKSDITTEPEDSEGELFEPVTVPVPKVKKEKKKVKKEKKPPTDQIVTTTATPTTTTTTTTTASSSSTPQPQPSPATPTSKLKMGTIGVLQPFDPSKDDFGMWYGAFTSFIVANGLDSTSTTDAKRCVGILLSSIGLPTYTLLSTLLAPAAPNTKSLSDLETALKDHFKPAPKALAERYKFAGRRQKSGETANEYAASLRFLAMTCQFGSGLEERIRDQFIFGLSSEGAQRHLFTKKDDISLQDTVAIAQAQEAAEASTALIRGSQSSTTPAPTEVHKTSNFRSQQSPHSSGKGKGKYNKDRNQGTQNPKSNGGKKQFNHNHNSNNDNCGGCGSSQHARPECPHLKSKCYNCGTVGHISKACRKKKNQGNSSSRDNHHIRVDQMREIRMVRSQKSDIIRVNVTINGHHHPMELDTGCESSILSEDFWRDTLQSPNLQKSNLVFRTYTNDTFRPKGSLQCVIGHNGEVNTFDIPVSTGTSLFGRDLLRIFQVDWNAVQQQCHHVSTDSSTQLKEMLKEYEDIFKAPTSADRIRHFKAQIIMKDDATPRFLKARPVPYSIKAKVDKELELMETTGVISKIDTSEWASPLVVVPKPDGRVRITGDFKNTVNSQLCITQYPLAIPSDLLAGVSGGNTFSKLDGSNAYHQIEISESSKKFMVINTHRGLYQYNVLPQGIASSPAIFQQFVDMMLKDIPCTGSFIDDAITSGATDSDHLTHLRSIFERMRLYNYKLSFSKCAFLQDKITFLGHSVSKQGIETTTEKVQAIVHIPAPTTVTEVKSFLGLVNFYGKFVPNLSSICEPLYRLTKKETDFLWTKQCTAAFSTVKQLLSSSPTLAHYDPSKAIGVSCDASPTGLGAVLFLKDDTGNERPVEYASKLLSDTERRYSQIEKEGLSIIFAIKKFYKYVCGRQFLLITDHKPLLSIFGPKTHLPPLVATRLHHWSLYLSQFQYEVLYRKSGDHGNADALSRLPQPTKSLKKITGSPTSDMLRVGSSIDDDCGLSMGGTNWESSVNFLANNQLEAMPITAAIIKSATSKDPTLSTVMQLIHQGWPPKLNDENKHLQPFHTRRDELQIQQGVIMWGIRVVIPSELQKQILSQLHECHTGIVRMKAIAREHVYWPGIDQDIEKVAKSCTSCLQISPSPPSAPLHPWQFPEKPWQRLHIDLAGPFLNRMWLILVDSHSKWPEVYCMNNNTTSSAVIHRLVETFSRFGIPEQLVSDNGRQFTSGEFENFCKANHIKHILSSPYHPRTNGEAERFVRTFKEAMKTSDTPIDLRLQKFLISYRATPHATTGASPSEVLQGRRIRTLMDLVHPDIATSTRASQARQEQNFNHRVKARGFQLNQSVWVQTYAKGEEKWSMGKVVKVVGPVTFIIQVGEKQIKRHVDQMLAALPQRDASSSPTQPEEVPGSSSD